MKKLQETEELMKMRFTAPETQKSIGIKVFEPTRSGNEIVLTVELSDGANGEVTNFPMSLDAEKLRELLTEIDFPEFID